MSTQIKEYTTVRRFIISGLRVFLSGFLPVMIFFLDGKTTIDYEALRAALVAGSIAGLYLVLKFVQEKLSGRI